MQLANYFASAPVNNADRASLMPRKMHVRWNDLEKRDATKRTNSKPVNVDEYDVKSEGTGNKSVNSDLYQALFPIYHLSKLSGVFPVRYAGQASGRYEGRLNIVDTVYSLCLLAGLVGSEIWGFWRDLRDGWEHSTRLKSQNAMIVTCSDILGVMSLTAASIVSSILQWKYVQIVIEKLVDCDEKLEMVSPRKTRRYTILVTLCSVTYCIVLSGLDIYTWGKAKQNKKLDDKGPINYVPLYFMYVVIIMMEIQYAIATYNVGQRFSRLNKCLENMLKNGRITDQFRKDLGLAGDLRDQGLAAFLRQDLGSTRMFRRTKIVNSFAANDGKGSADNISQLVTVHASLCDTVSYINSAYGAVILVVTLTCLIHLIITPYFLIMEADGKREPVFLLVQAMWCIFHIWRLLIFVQPSYATTAEGKATAVLVSQLLSANIDKESKKQLEIFSLQILHRPLEFSACGLFSLNRGLVTSIAGAVTTYLVILIQFQKDDDSKGSFDNMLKNATQMLRNVSAYHNITGKSGLG